MNFNFSRHNLTGMEKAFQRVCEVIPGLLSWTVILGSFILSFFQPLFVAVAIVAFDFYWLLRIIYMTVFLILSYFRLSVEKSTDWMARVKGLDNFGAYLPGLPETVFTPPPESHACEGVDEWLSGRDSAPRFERNPEKTEATAVRPRSFTLRSKKGLSLFLHKKELLELKAKGVKFPRSENIHHLIIIPVARESADIVEPGMLSMISGSFPSKRILVVFALEERAKESVKKGVLALKEKYKGDFLDVLVSAHPDGIAGEARVKGANATHAAKEAAGYLEAKKIPFENVIVSCFDSDTVVNPEYFACLTYRFMVTPERTRASFQPIPVYYNNIWNVPGFARVLETGSSFFQLIEATNPEKMVTFSSHSMSFKALVDVGYWPVDMVSDDSAIFWKSYVCFDGNYRVVPMYTTLSMDIVAADSVWKTMVNVYKQKRRWAWGVENFPIVMRGFAKNKRISLYNKFRLGFKLLEGHIAWTTWAFLLTIVGWLPALFATKAFQHSVVYYNAPRVAGTIFNLAGFSLVASIILSIFLLPPKKTKHPLFQRLIFAFEWLLVPLIYLFLSAVPALDAQTRLMLGKRMEFWVAEKGRRK